MSVDDFRVTVEGKDGLVVGYLSARVEEARYLSHDCRASLYRLAARHEGLSTTRVYRVGRSVIGRAFRNEGLGIELYTRAVEQASAEGMALVADDCAAPPGASRTSEMAKRVWSSRRFARAVDVEGIAAAVW